MNVTNSTEPAATSQLPKMNIRPSSARITKCPAVMFANMTAGHFVILALLGLIFIFGSWLVAAGSVLFVTFMMFLELLVAFLQAYIFALLTSVFIGMMQHAH